MKIYEKTLSAFWIRNKERGVQECSGWRVKVKFILYGRRMVVKWKEAVLCLAFLCIFISNKSCLCLPLPPFTILLFISLFVQVSIFFFLFFLFLSSFIRVNVFYLEEPMGEGSVFCPFACLFFTSSFSYPEYKKQTSLLYRPAFPYLQQNRKHLQGFFKTFFQTLFSCFFLKITGSVFNSLVFISALSHWSHSSVQFIFYYSSFSLFFPFHHPRSPFLILFCAFSLKNTSLSVPFINVMPCLLNPFWTFQHKKHNTISVSQLFLLLCHPFSTHFLTLLCFQIASSQGKFSFFFTMLFSFSMISKLFNDFTIFQSFQF